MSSFPVRRDVALAQRTLVISRAIGRRRGIVWSYANRRALSPVQDIVREHIRDRQMYEPCQ